jgi:hypothetical protein
LATTGTEAGPGKRAEFFVRGGTVVATTDLEFEGTTVVVGVVVVAGRGSAFAPSTAIVVDVVVGAIVATDA